jgi:carboxypeptidase PM20D1
MIKFFLIITLLLSYWFSLLAIRGTIDTIPHSAQVLSEYIKHPSLTGDERMAGLYFSTLASQKGLYVEILTDDPGSFNFTASLYPLESGKPNIVFLNHIDVVPATEEAEREYTYPPFSGTIAEGMVWGRGAIDNKGMGVMQLLAIERFVELAAETDLPFNVTMLSVSGEETGGYKGAKIVTEDYLELINPVVVYGEGGSGIPGILKRDPDRKLFGISVAFKQSLWLELTLKNITSGHGAVPPPDYVAKEKIVALNNIINRNRKIIFSETTRNMFYELGKVEGGLRGLALRNLRLFRPFVIPEMKREEVVKSLITNTVTITSIRTPSGPPNQIPQEISVVLDCRLLPETDPEAFIAEIRDVLNNQAIEIRELHGRDKSPSTAIDDFYYYMKRALENVYAGSAVIPILAPASNDNNYFRVHNIPTYGILPVYIPLYLLETIHNVDERLPVDALEKGISVYSELISILIESVFDGTVTD